MSWCMSPCSYDNTCYVIAVNLQCHKPTTPIICHKTFLFYYLKYPCHVSWACDKNFMSQKLLLHFNFGAAAFASPLNTRLTHHASKLSRAPKCLGHRPTAIQQFAHDVMSVAEVQACATLKLHNMNMMMYFKFRIPVWTNTLVSKNSPVKQGSRLIITSMAYFRNRPVKRIKGWI